MTTQKQWTYISLFFIIFIVVIPLIVLYSHGYRINSKLKIVKTGGIYCVNREIDARIKINNKVKKTSGIFERNLLVQYIKPGTYNVKVEKNGFRTWEKNITVQETMVEVCYPLLVREDLSPVEIPRYLPPDEVEMQKGKKIKLETNDEFTDANELFEAEKNPRKGLFVQWQSKDTVKLKLGQFRKLRGKVFLFKEGNKLFVQWRGKKEQRPFFIQAQGKIEIFSPEKKITAFDFYPNRDDAFLVRYNDGSIDAVEIDTRFGVRNIHKIVKYCDRFLVSDEMFFFFAGGKLFKIDFEK